MKRYIFAALSVAISTFTSGTASAAPPSSCAGKFIGVWNHGNNNIGTLSPSGVASCSGNPACQQGTWTCEGNTLLYTNSMGTYNYTLQPNGTMTYNNIVVTRIGGKPSPAREPAAPPSTAAAAPYPEKQVLANNARALFHAGQAAANEGSASSLPVAEGNFINAAEEYRKAGDFKNERIARANAAKVAKAAQRLETGGNTRRGPLTSARRHNPGTSGRQSNSAGNSGRTNLSQEEIDRRHRRDSLVYKQKCADYRAALAADTRQSPVYTKELTAAVKGACN